MNVGPSDMDENQLTEWGDPKEMIRSQYGTVPFHAWCECEAKRMNKAEEKLRMNFSKPWFVALNPAGECCVTREANDPLPCGA